MMAPLVVGDVLYNVLCNCPGAWDVIGPRTCVMVERVERGDNRSSNNIVWFQRSNGLAHIQQHIYTAVV